MMFKKIILSLSLAALSILPVSLSAADSVMENDQIARVNWNINIGGWYGYGCPYGYPYCAYPPPCGSPIPVVPTLTLVVSIGGSTVLT